MKESRQVQHMSNSEIANNWNRIIYLEDEENSNKIYLQNDKYNFKFFSKLLKLLMSERFVG